MIEYSNRQINGFNRSCDTGICPDYIPIQSTASITEKYQVKTKIGETYLTVFTRDVGNVLPEIDQRNKDHILGTRNLDG